MPEGDRIYGLIKPAVDAHTLGIQTVAELLLSCGQSLVLAPAEIGAALDLYDHEVKRRVILDWISEEGINRLGISYRLDEQEAVRMTGYLVEAMKARRLFSFQGGPVDLLFFAGLPAACDAIREAHQGLVKTFRGGESIQETLQIMGVPPDHIPADLRESSQYDQDRMAFGKSIIDSQAYQGYRAPDRSGYPEYGSDQDTVEGRLEANLRPNFEPLIRAHVGPYSSSARREESVEEFIGWVGRLAKSGLMDILSIGTSQLTQSNFGEDWTGKPNGGGVPINSPDEYRLIREVARPMLVRTYAGTKRIPQLAALHERTLNICWHALSLWWFNQLDGRGPYEVYTNLRAHRETLSYIADTGKPFEANVSHHFAFRGADDLTYIVSAYLAAKLAKRAGIRTFILQNMLNTPRLTWGIQDLAKSRALLKIVRLLEDRTFKVHLQPRAGLDYFKPDLHEARIQLAAVTALMDDIEPDDETSPPIIHVVSYSEASHLATPGVIDESIRISQYALQKYRGLRRRGDIDPMGDNPEVKAREDALVRGARALILALEKSVDDLYSPEGFYKIFAAGFLPVPYLWGGSEEFRHARDWVTRPVKGGVQLVDEKTGRPLSVEDRVAVARQNLKDAEYALKERQGQVGGYPFKGPDLLYPV